MTGTKRDGPGGRDDSTGAAGSTGAAVTGLWAAAGPSVSPGMPGLTVTLVEGSTFCISGPGGDIHPESAQGLFVRDTRVVSRWELTVDGSALQPLTVQQPQPHGAAFVGRVPPPAGRADSTLLIERARYVGEGMREDVTIRVPRR